ncbi:MAG: proline dehydrogenase family protein [Ignavibacteria bacterium]|nr:proline dehydrogenase family protein [Ignavibacteria bacterium]
MSLINELIVSFVQTLPKSVVKKFSNRYIAGDSLQDAVLVVQDLNRKGIHATIDVLGEAITTKEEATASKQACSDVLDAIRKLQLKANLSIKPTQMGLKLDEQFAYQQVLTLVEKAKGMQNFVRLDMEDSTCTDATIRLFNKLRETHDNCGIVVQAYMRRTLSDLISLSALKPNVRLCKGIYIEPVSIAFKGKEEIRKNYLDNLKWMFENKHYVGIATHDSYLIDEAINLIQTLKIPRDAFEFQMLLGVHEDLRDYLAESGYKVRIYVPFGKDWYLYSIRRLKENPNVAGQIVKNLFSRH